MKLSRDKVVLCKVPMPSEELRKFKLRPGLIVSKDFTIRYFLSVCGVEQKQRYVNGHYNLFS